MYLPFTSVLSFGLFLTCLENVESVENMNYTLVIYIYICHVVTCSIVLLEVNTSVYVVVKGLYEVL